MENSVDIHEDRMIRLPEICRLTGISKSTIYRLIGQGRFPKSVSGGDRLSLWRLREVMAWNRDRNASPPGTWE